MVNLRPRERNAFTGFTTAEIEKMENLFKEPGEQSLNREFYIGLAKRFNLSKDRGGKHALKWAEVETWFVNRQHSHRSENGVSLIKEDKLSPDPEAGPDEAQKVCEVSKAGGKVSVLSNFEFEARSPTDGAWYDVDQFLAHRFLNSGEAEVLVKYVGFGEEENEWVNLKKDIRERSVHLEHSECGKVKVGDLVVCFQERNEVAKYFDAHVVEIQRKMHDIRGCRCIFLIKYDHDTIEERVQLDRLCCRPL